MNRPPIGHVDLQAMARQEMLANGFEPEFPPQVQRQLGELSAHPPQVAPSAAVRDLRDLLWSSIDNDTSRDLDQIEFAERLPNGETKILVGIADVDTFVPKDLSHRFARRKRDDHRLHGRQEFPHAARAAFHRHKFVAGSRRQAEHRDRVCRRHGRSRPFRQRLPGHRSQQGSADVQRRGRLAGEHERSAGESRCFTGPSNAAQDSG